MRTRSRVSAICAYDGVSPPTSSAAHSSIRFAPPSCAANADASELAAISSTGLLSAITNPQLSFATLPPSTHSLQPPPPRPQPSALSPKSVHARRRQQRILLLRVADRVAESFLQRVGADVAVA